MVNVLVVYAHPCEGSFVAALRDHVVASLHRHHVEVLDLNAVGFDARMTHAEHAGHCAPLATKPEVVPFAEQLRRCHTLVLVYPTWWGGQPAVMKGWLERVWVNEVAFKVSGANDRPGPGLRNVRRIVAVTTHGSSKWINALEGEGGKRTVKRSMRSACGWRCRSRWIAMYGVDTSTAEQRAKFLERVSRRIARLR